MTKVTAVKAGFAGKNFGTFKVEKFSMFDDDDLEKYADLRNRMADVSLGIKMEMMREYSRKTTTETGEGESRATETTEEVILVIHYWERPVTRHRGDSDEDVRDAKNDLTPDHGVLVPARGLPARAGSRG